MIDTGMYLGIGFLAAGLSLLMIVPFVHDRAVRLTTRRVEDAQPSRAEVLADKDLQRAAFALSMRRLEIKLQELKDKHACQLAELGRKTDVVNQLRMETDGLRDLLRKAEHISVCTTNEARELRRLASQRGSDLVETTDALEAARCQLEEEQTTFANFRDRIAAFMCEIAAQINEEKERDLHRQQDLQHRLSTQSQLLSEAECERNQLRRQLEIAHDVAHAMRTEVVEVERHVIAEVEALKRENTRLHGTLHRANGDRTRLAYELAKSQARGTRAA
jgi:DNA anti-recombination protein RmuC